ncbi:MAG: HAD family phosphatase [Elusimicrobiota bacterium]
MARLSRLPDIKRFAVIFFDVGNVLVKFDIQLIIDSFERLAGRPLKARLTWLWMQHIGDAFEEGRLSAQDFYGKACKALAIEITQARFWGIMNSSLSPIYEMVELASELKRRGHRLHVISNSNVVHGDFMLANYPFMASMDGFTWSYEAGVRKPKKRIYEIALASAKAAPGECFFIDDRPENVTAAHSCGITAVLCKDPKALAADYLKQLVG